MVGPEEIVVYVGNEGLTFPFLAGGELVPEELELKLSSVDFGGDSDWPQVGPGHSAHVVLVEIVLLVAVDEC